MAILNILYRYPTNVLYEKAANNQIIPHFVTSFVGQVDKTIHLYREIIRVSDGARQILRMDESGSASLYLDRECQRNTSITFNREWTYQNRPVELPELPPSDSRTSGG